MMGPAFFGMFLLFLFSFSFGLGLGVGKCPNLWAFFDVITFKIFQVSLADDIQKIDG